LNLGHRGLRLLCHIKLSAILFHLRCLFHNRIPYILRYRQAALEVAVLHAHSQSESVTPISEFQCHVELPFRDTVVVATCNTSAFHVFSKAAVHRLFCRSFFLFPVWRQAYLAPRTSVSITYQGGIAVSAPIQCLAWPAFLVSISGLVFQGFLHYMAISCYSGKHPSKL